MNRKDIDNLNFKIIGKVESSFKEKFGTPRNSQLSPSSKGKIRLFPEVVAPESLDGLETFSHLWVIYHFHLNDNKKTLTKIFPPKLEGEKKGVLATRSPHHINPIGLSVVKIERIEGHNIFIEDLDIVDGTPVIDIKPYLPKYDSIPQASHGWVPEITDVEVQFSPKAIKQLSEVNNFSRLKGLILETLRQDPRPTSYKRKDEVEQTYWITVENLNVGFSWKDTFFMVDEIQIKK